MEVRRLSQLSHDFSPARSLRAKIANFDIAKTTYSSTSCQVLSGLNSAIALANFAVSDPRSF